MRKDSRSIRLSGPYTSPATPEYDHNNVGQIPKSWSSERVPLPTNNSRRHINASALIPFNSSAKTVPSKWDDAERWITSPILGYNSVRCSLPQPHRRPKSKSGPLGPPGLVYLSSYSSVGNSPFANGVSVRDGLSDCYNDGIGVKSDSLYGSNDLDRGTSAPSLSDSVDDKIHVTKEEMATRMSPQRSTNISSSKERLSFSNLRSISNVAAKDEIRDVQVDKGTDNTRTGLSKRQGLKKTKKDVSNSVENFLPLPWNASEPSKNASKLQREEAKITAWENLQKAKAEAAIRKLEMKLEKKRSASTNRILNKLRAAQIKAEEAMRNLVSEKNNGRRALTTSRMGFSCCICVDTSSLTNRSIYRRN